MENADESFLRGVDTAAHEHGMQLKYAHPLEDGFTELVICDPHDSELEMSIDFRRCEEQFHGHTMLEVRTFEDPEHTTPKIFYVTAIPYVLFGVLYCEV
jgi:hypothetical protein